MREVKLYRIYGMIRKGNLLDPIRFRREVRATGREQAVERIYSEVGSHHRAKRHEIRILEVEELEED
ncbi:50S ribosomal protein L18a [Candidatus Bathyarchaeota archaeon]|nr:50S ribosomal protein L18a [Candidatus Bathyarchaeota archaeon]